MKSEYINCRGKDITPVCASFIPAKTTNADRIRNMTDEELAKWITSIDGDYICPPDNSCNCGTGGCVEGWLRWLKKSVETEGATNV